MGRCLYRMLPEDRFDRQPLKAEEGRLLLVADVRIDNREELLNALGEGRAARLCDADLLLRGWSRWREKLLDRIAGDFAFAIWDWEAETLTLARDALGERPLHYCEGQGFFAFASMARGLIGLPGIDGGADEERMAQFVADLPPTGPRGYYRSIKRVEPGHIVRISRAGVETCRYWDPRGPELRLPRIDDYGDALREQLDRAVRARLRRAQGSVGSHLSSGFDSGAVTTSAAILLNERGERLHAFTSAPREGFEGPVPAGFVADESRLAAATAARYANIDHHIVRPDGPSPLSLLDDAHRDAGQPVGHVCNNIWFSAIAERAQANGVSVMLTGETGNFSISAGLALDQLPDFIRHGRLAAWLHESRALTKGNYSWKNVLNTSISPWLPRRLYSGLRGLQRSYFQAGEDLRFVGPTWKARMARQAAAAGWDPRPPRNSKDRRWALLQTFDPGNFRKRSLARWGVEERDATADRRLIQFCFSLPPEAYLKDGVRRPAMRLALGKRLGAEALDRPLRGYQTADWYERFTKQDVLNAVEDIEARGAPPTIDLAALRSAAAHWPTEGWADRTTIYLYRAKLLRTLSAAHFSAAAASANG